MKIRFLLAGAGLAACGALQAGETLPSGQLDLSLPDTSVYAADPPGKYYGDTSGKPAAASTGAAAAEDDVVDDGKAKVWGSVSTGIGHASGYGTSHWSAADVNVSKTYTDDDGDKRTFDLHIGVGKGDGPMFFGPRMHWRGPGPGFAPGPWTHSSPW